MILIKQRSLCPITFASFVCLALLNQQAAAATVFSDTFDAENGGLPALNYTGFDQWTVSNGAVDLIGAGFFDFYPGNGLYVDLDGSTGTAGTLTSDLLELTAGVYELSFELGYNAQGPADNQMTVSLGDYSELFVNTDAGFPAFNLIERTITVTADGFSSIVFDHQGGDQFGFVIDDVLLTRVPEPSGVLGAFLGLAVTLAIRFRRQSLQRSF